MLQNGKKVLRALDLFGNPVELQYNSNNIYTTTLGGCASIIIAIIFISIFNSSIIGFFRHQFISFNIKELTSLDHSVTLTSQNSKIAIGLSGYDISHLKDLFELKAQQRLRFSNGTSLKLPLIQFQPCQKNDWSALSSEFGDYYDANQMYNYACFNNYNFTMQGQFGSQVFRYLKISLDPCSGSNCHPNLQDEIKKVVDSTGGYLQLNIIYQNTAINYEDTYEPFYIFPDKAFYRFVPFYTQQNVDHFIKPVIMNTDISVFPFQNIRHQNNVTFPSYSSSFELPYNSNDSSFFQSFFRVDSKAADIGRNVMSLDDFLSFLGGIFSILHLLGSYFISPYARFQYLIEIFNQLFYIDKGQLKNEKQPQKAMQNYKQISKLDSDFCSFICMTFQRCCGKQSIFYHSKAIDKVQQEIDIARILSKLSFLEAGLRVLLDKNEIQCLQMIERKKVKFVHVQDQQVDVLGNQMPVQAVEQEDYQKKRQQQQYEQVFRSTRRLRTRIKQLLSEQIGYIDISKLPEVNMFEPNTQHLIKHDND